MKKRSHTNVQYVMLALQKKSTLTTHVNRVHGKPFVCSICDNNFGRKSTLHNHMRSVHEENKLWIYSRKVPNMPKKNFTQKDELKRHIAPVHEKKKPFMCSICDQRFTRQGSLNMHIRSVHEEKKPHKCSICDASFAEKKYFNDTC